MFIKEPIIEQCRDCNRHDGTYCSVYIAPVAKWRNQNCPMATHLIIEKKKDKKINPLKKSKRSRGR